MNDLTETTLSGYWTPTTAPTVAALRNGLRAMVIGRRLDRQASNLAKQGYLTVYPSSHGQEACQVAAAQALGPNDWLFPTYRDSVAMFTHRIDPVEVLTMLRGDWHCGFDPKSRRCAPHATPLATQCAHAVGLAVAAKKKGEDRVALALCGDGATSEGDFHEALNLAAVLKAPVVFLVQHNGYAISVPSKRQFRAKSLADKAVGYGIRGEKVDGNDFVATLSALSDAVEYARAGNGPVLVEARTYRLAPHTNADDPDRYRARKEAEPWLDRDPIVKLASQLEASGHLAPDTMRDIEDAAEIHAADLRKGVMTLPETDPSRLFANVYADPPPHLCEQRRDVLSEEAFA